MSDKNHAVTVRLSEADFQALSLQQKTQYLKTQSGKEKMDLILADSDARRLAASLESQEFFWLIKEVGEADAVELLRLASAEQCVFILDMELWEGWTFSEDVPENAIRQGKDGPDPRRPRCKKTRRLFGVAGVLLAHQRSGRG